MKYLSLVLILLVGNLSYAFNIVNPMNPFGITAPISINPANPNNIIYNEMKNKAVQDRCFDNEPPANLSRPILVDLISLPNDGSKMYKVTIGFCSPNKCYCSDVTKSEGIEVSSIGKRLMVFQPAIEVQHKALKQSMNQVSVSVYRYEKGASADTMKLVGNNLVKISDLEKGAMKVPLSANYEIMVRVSLQK